MRNVFVLALAMVAAAGLAIAQPGRPDAAHRLATAASEFLAALQADHRDRASLRFEDAARKDWKFVPGERAGLRLRDMSDEERAAAHRLLRAALSSRGYLKADSIMQLERLLRELSVAAGHEDVSRDPGQYAFAVFGTPDPEGAWGWRVEGHHISLNFTAAPGRQMSVTPAFLGSSPAQIKSGPNAGFRVLAAEDDLARELLRSLEPSQRQRAVVEREPPRDIVMSPGRTRGELGDPIGLLASEMTEAQRGMLMRLIEEYAANFRDELAEEQMARIREAGIDQIRFSWFGGTAPGDLHYYRIHGPTFVIEYDTTQGDPNHVHTVWRDLERDFGADPLGEHYQHEHH